MRRSNQSPCCSDSNITSCRSGTSHSRETRLRLSFIGRSLFELEALFGKIEPSVADVGGGDGRLCEVNYRNRATQMRSLLDICNLELNRFAESYGFTQAYS